MTDDEESGGSRPATGTDVERRARRARLVGTPVARREDSALVTGNASYTEDRTAPRMAYLTFVRSPHGHAIVEAVDVGEAAAMDGVLGVFTWDDVRASGIDGRLDVDTSMTTATVPGHPILAADRVRYAGQPVAAVVAERRYRAADAARAVDVAYERLDAVVDPVDAASKGPPTRTYGRSASWMARCVSTSSA